MPPNVMFVDYFTNRRESEATISNLKLSVGRLCPCHRTKQENNCCFPAFIGEVDIM